MMIDSKKANEEVSMFRPAEFMHFQAGAGTSVYVDSTEPPLLAAGTRLALGDMQLQAKAWTAAEQTFRADLKQHPHSGWALRGLAQALKGQGKGDTADAATQRAALDKSWAVADVSLRQSPP